MAFSVSFSHVNIRYGCHPVLEIRQSVLGRQVAVLRKFLLAIRKSNIGSWLVDSQLRNRQDKSLTPEGLIPMSLLT
jgi:hypothetical protein